MHPSLEGLSLHLEVPALTGALRQLGRGLLTGAGPPVWPGDVLASASPGPFQGTPDGPASCRGGGGLRAPSSLGAGKKDACASVALGPDRTRTRGGLQPSASWSTQAIPSVLPTSACSPSGVVPDAPWPGASVLHGSCLSSCVLCPLPSLTTQPLGVGSWPVCVGSSWVPFLWGLLNQSAQWDNVGGHLGRAGVRVGLSAGTLLRALAVSANRGVTPQPPRANRTQEPLGSVRVSTRALPLPAGERVLTPAGRSPMPP